jgi:hypothetical protein
MLGVSLFVLFAVSTLEVITRLTFVFGDFTLVVFIVSKVVEWP